MNSVLWSTPNSTTPQTFTLYYGVLLVLLGGLGQLLPIDIYFYTSVNHSLDMYVYYTVLLVLLGGLVQLLPKDISFNTSVNCFLDIYSLLQSTPGSTGRTTPLICNCTVSLFSIIIPIHSMKYSIHIQKKFICKNCYLKVAFVVQRTSSFIILSKFKLFKFMELKNLEIQNKYRG